MVEVDLRTNGIRLKIFEAPVAKGRPRLGKGKAFTPKKTRLAESVLRWNANHALLGSGSGLFEGPLSVAIVFGLERPKSKYKAKYPDVRPDIDNYAKLVCDAMNGILWHDDGQICELTLKKIYSDVEYTEIICEQLIFSEELRRGIDHTPCSTHGPDDLDSVCRDLLRDEEDVRPKKR